MTLLRSKRVSRRARAALRFSACIGCGYESNVQRRDCPSCGADLPPPVSTERAFKRRGYYEDAHQQSLFEWVKLQKAAYPDLAKLYHVPNGGGRSKAEAGRLKAQGVVAGVLDLSLDVARGGYFGLRIELKATKAELGEKPRVSTEQRKRIADLREDGYYADVCEGWEQARELLLHYLSLPRTAQGTVA